MEEQKKALFDARTEYLQQKTLLQELEGLTDEAQHALIHANNSSVDPLEDVSAAADAKLQQAGFDCPAKVIQSVAEHLRAAYIAQRLQLPLMPRTDPLNMQSHDAQSSGQQYGSKHHILGITPLDVRKRRMPSRREARKAHAPIVPILERRLEHLKQQAVEAIAGPSAGPDAASQVVSLAETKYGDVSKARAAVLGATSKYIQTAQLYLQELIEIQRILEKILSECILVEQPQLDKDHREFLAEALNNLTSKLQVMQMQIRSSTYTRETVPALKIINQELETAKHNLTEQADEISAKMEAYKQESQEFHDIVRRYRSLMAEAERIDLLQTSLNVVEAEARQIAKEALDA